MTWTMGSKTENLSFLGTRIRYGNFKGTLQIGPKPRSLCPDVRDSWQTRYRRSEISKKPAVRFPDKPGLRTVFSSGASSENTGLALFRGQKWIPWLDSCLAQT
jgi:hypothetical protein